MKKPNADAKPKMSNKEYAKELRKLQVELCTLQDWVKHKGQRIIVVFEGRDGAGKGGTIRAHHRARQPARLPRRGPSCPVGPREDVRCTCSATCSTFLPPARSSSSIAVGTTARESSMSWAFARKEQHRRFLELCPVLESYIVASGIMLIKFWLEVSNEEQERRFKARIEDPAAPVEAQPDGLAFPHSLV